MKIWQLIEAIDDPSGLVHPERHQAFATGQHPLGRHPAYPEVQRGAEGSAENYEEVLASKQWQKILQKANRYLGVPLSRRSLPLIQQKTVQALQLIQQAESQYQEELQALAIELVFSLPEFKTARQAYENEQILIDANLVSDRSDLNTDQMMTSDEPEAQEPLNAPEKQRTPAEQQWMEKTVQRRHFTNAMIQGSAVSNDFLFELAGERLDAIHPGLRAAYGILMVATEVGYWIFPQSMVLQGAKDKTHVGVSQVRREQPEEQAEEQPEGEEQQPPQQGRPVVHAQAACFPVLIQEIIKGLTELASLSAMAGLPNDPDDRREVLNKTDLTDMEAWHMLLGPKLWDSFIEAVDAENERELTFHLYSRIQRMDHDEFNGFMREVLAKSPRGMQMLRDLAVQIKAELAGDQGDIMAEAQEIVRKIIETDEADWKDVTLMPRCPKIPRFPGDVTGCGSTNVCGPDDEGLYDCMDCGIFFKQEAQDPSNPPVAESDDLDDWKEVTGPSHESIENALNRINGTYGRGNIVSIDYDKGIVHTKKQYGSEKLPFRVEGNTVKFLQRSLKLRP